MEELVPESDAAPRKIFTRKALLIISFILGLVGIFVVLTIIFPEIFYDKFLYKYYIKSYLADSEYNPVDTTTYGLMIAAAIFGIYRMLVRLNIKVDRRGIYVIIPWMLMGGTYRALEDSEFFQKPVIYFFRSPMIYFTIALTVIIVLLYSTWVQVHTERRKSWKRGFVLSLLMLVFFDILYIVYYYSTDRGISYRFTPLYPVLLTVMLSYPLYADARRRGRGDMKTNILVAGLYFLFLSILPIAVWPKDAPWLAYYRSIPHGAPELLWWPAVGTLVLAVAATLLLVGIFKFLEKRDERLGVFSNPLSMLIIFGHFFDASATSIGIRYYGYVEKHYVPHHMIQLTGTPFVMFLLKLPLVLLVIYALDIWYRDEFRDNENLLNLVKMGIIILGIAPGLRDALRMAMGV